MPIQYGGAKITPHAVYSDKDGKLTCTCRKPFQSEIDIHRMKNIASGNYQGLEPHFQSKYIRLKNLPI